MSKDYFGNGETFLFTFKKTDEIKVYNWEDNSDKLVYCNS